MFIKCAYKNTVPLSPKQFKWCMVHTKRTYSPEKNKSSWIFIRHFLRVLCFSGKKLDTSLTYLCVCIFLLQTHIHTHSKNDDVTFCVFHFSLGLFIIYYIVAFLLRLIFQVEWWKLRNNRCSLAKHKCIKSQPIPTEWRTLNWK